MTFKDLKKRVSTATQQRFQILEALRDKPFWVWDVESHRLEDTRTSGNCCFNHIIGLPRKSRLEKPIFDYENMIIDNLHSPRHLWIKKATGLGVSELLLRYMSWLCVKDDSVKDTQMCIVTGSRIDLAITLIDRMKRLFVERIPLKCKSTILVSEEILQGFLIFISINQIPWNCKRLEVIKDELN